jgi:hypothetical protein
MVSFYVIIKYLTKLCVHELRIDTRNKKLLNLSFKDTLILDKLLKGNKILIKWFIFEIFI